MTCRCVWLIRLLDEDEGEGGPLRLDCVYDIPDDAKKQTNLIWRDQLLLIAVGTIAKV